MNIEQVYYWLNKDWRVKDNLTIALNIINRRIAENSSITDDNLETCKGMNALGYISIGDLVGVLVRYVNKKKLPLLEASILLKSRAKDGTLKVKHYSEFSVEE